MGKRKWAYAVLALGLGLALAQNGQALYGQHCATCHQANGQGLPGAFPLWRGTCRRSWPRRRGAPTFWT